MAQYLLFGGALNTVFLGLPAYLWLMLALVLVIGATFVIWFFFFWEPLKPVHGHFTAHLHKINSALTFDEHLNFVMISEKKAKLIFDASIKEAKELQKDWDYAPSGLIGKVLCDLVFSANDWTRIGSPTRLAIERVASVYNDTHEDDRVMTLDKFHKYLVGHKFDGIEGISEIKPYYTVNWRRIDFAIPEDHIQPMWDGYLRQLARMIDEDMNASSVTYGYIILGGSILICLGMLAIRFLS